MAEWVLGGQPHSITCTRCRVTFLGFAPSQAEGCASELVTHADGSRDITGFYGSCVADMEVYSITRPELLSGVADGVICDECISSLAEEGALGEPEGTDMSGRKLSEDPVSSSARCNTVDG